MLLVIDAGNTNVVVAVSEGKHWRGSWRIRTEAQRTSDEYAVWLLTLIEHAGIRKEDISAAVIGTVVPAALYHLRRLCRDWFSVEPLVAVRRWTGVLRFASTIPTRSAPTGWPTRWPGTTTSAAR